MNLWPEHKFSLKDTIKERKFFKIESEFKNVKNRNVGQQTERLAIKTTNQIDHVLLLRNWKFLECYKVIFHDPRQQKLNVQHRPIVY